jgi:hypothetical protein
MRDFLKQLETQVRDLETWKKSETARHKLSILDAKVGHYVLLAKTGVWTTAALGALAIGFVSWWVLAGTPQALGLGVAALVIVYALFKIWRLVANPPKASAILLEEVESRVAPLRVVLRIFRFLLPNPKTNG